MVAGPARAAAVLSAVALAAGAGAGAAQAVRPASGQNPPAAAAPGLPPGWPAGLGLPAGTIQASSGSAGSWTVQLLARGSAAAVKRSAVDFYRARGYRQVADGVLDKGSRRITVVVENRDHSPTETILVVGVTDAAAGGSAAPVATRVSTPARVTLARARRHGLVVRFRAPAGTARATVRVLRAGTRRPVSTVTSSQTRAGANRVTVPGAALRRGLTPGRYRIAVVLRDAARRTGRSVAATVRIVGG